VGQLINGRTAFRFPDQTREGVFMRGKAMKQISKNKSDKNINEKILLEALLNLKATALLDLTKRMIMCEKSLNEWGIIPTEVSIFYNLHKDKSLLKEWDDINHKYQMDLDVSSADGSLKLKSCFNLVKKILSKYLLDNNKNLHEPLKACALLGGYNYKNMQTKDITTFFNIESLLRGACCEAIGYWTAKLEEKKRNKDIVDKTVVEQGRKNKEAIKNIIAEMKITSLTDFRKNKILRSSFLAKAQEKTKEVDKKHNWPLSEKRIFDIARASIKEQKTLD
jgi:hypothetical protein